MNDYGGWQRPAFGKLHTRSRGKAVPHSNVTLFALPREGAGDFRPPLLLAKGNGADGRSDPAARFHNPVRVVIESDVRSHRPPVYIPLHNDHPEFVPYRYRAPGWRERIARFGLLDLLED